MRPSIALPFTVMPGLDPGIQSRKSGSGWPLDRRVKPGHDKKGKRRALPTSSAGKGS